MGDHREGQGASNAASLLGSDGFCTAVAVSLVEEEKRQAEKHNANAASLLENGGFCTAVAVSLVEKEKWQAENHHAQRLVKEHIQENAHRYWGAS